MVHSVLRDRLKKVTYPVSRVRFSASAFMKPTISTSLLVVVLDHRRYQAIEFREIHGCLPIWLQKKTPPVTGGAA